MLTNSAVGTYSYPAAGNPRPHAVTGIAGGPLGTQPFTYDANGSMTVQGTSTRTYDGENRLVSATDGATTTAFVYGPDGARLKKTANGATTLYFGDDIEVIPGASPQYTKYLPGDAKRVGLGSGAVTTWLHRDHLRSVRAITDAAGAIVDRANYRPFGEQLGFATADESKGYIGERHDGETGLMYLHARYYDPVLARFIQADPMNPALRGVGVNRYAYASNNPIMFLDPSGLMWEPGPGQGNKETKTPGSGNIGDAKNSGSGDQGSNNSAGNYDPRQTQLACVKCYTAAPVVVGVVGRYLQAAWQHTVGITVAVAGVVGLEKLFSEDDPAPTPGQPVPGNGIPDWNGDPTTPPGTGTGVNPEETVASTPGDPTQSQQPSSPYDEDGKFTPDAGAAVELAKEAKKKGGLTQSEAEALVDVARDAGFSDDQARGPESHPDRKYKDDHIHIGPVDHIPVN